MLEPSESSEKSNESLATLERVRQLRRNNQPLEASRILMGLLRQEPKNDVL